MPRQPHYYTYPMPHGALTVRATERGITDVAFGAVGLPGENASTSLTNRAATELMEYFAGKRFEFDLPLDLSGSAFMLAVWQQIAKIPYAQTRTAAEVAALLGKPGSHASVGAAARKNPCAILVPDHRVVGANGEPLGSSPRDRIRRGLLAMERRYYS